MASEDHSTADEGSEELVIQTGNSELMKAITGHLPQKKYSIEDEEPNIEEINQELYELSDSGDEDLDLMLKKLKDAEVLKLQREQDDVEMELKIPPESLVSSKASTDDFIRNYLFQMGMMRTLDSFESEWYERYERGLIKPEEVGLVSDVYTRCQQLEELVMELQEDLKRYRASASKIKEKFSRVCKERDQHRMQHRRMVHEKNLLIKMMEELKDHYANYEPAMKMLQNQYEKAIRERIMQSIDKEKALAKVQSLENTIKSRTANTKKTQLDSEKHKMKSIKEDEKDLPPVEKPKGGLMQLHDSKFPPDKRINLYMKRVKGSSVRIEDYSFSLAIRAHDFGVGGVDVHPEDAIMASVSDDMTWKTWSFPNGEMLMLGKGHTEWLSSCSFNGVGYILATTSGDRTVKIWNYKFGTCTHTFADHQMAVWSSDWHSGGDFLATASLDFSAKIFDVNSLRCRQTLRGHKDSVNSVRFLDFSNILLTASSDCTLGLWDARTGFRGCIFQGHENTVTCAVFNLRGDLIASSDSKGKVKIWDIRAVKCTDTIDSGPSSCNSVAFDPTGTVIALANSDNLLRMYDVNSTQMTVIGEHEDTINSLRFQIAGQYLLSGGNDGLLKLWGHKIH